MEARLSNAGYIALHRKAFDNPIVGSNPTYFHAWFWLLCEAKWKPVRHRIPGKSVVIDLQRGQLSHSRSFIAKALNLSEQRVRTFLDHLKIEGMIAVEINQGQMVITICNYNIYQKDDEEDNQQVNQPINQPITSEQPELNKDNKEKKDIDGDASPERGRQSTQKSKRNLVLMTPAPDEGSEAFRLLRSNFMDYAAKKSIVGRFAENEFEAFLDHHRARGAMWANWRSAGQTWIRNAVKFASERAAQQPQRRGHDL
jgi:hypothetical protein